MAEKDQDGPDVDQFLRDHIDTVPHLEALLLLWNSRPKEWSVEEMAKGLFLPPEAAKEILEDLLRQHLTVRISGSYEAFRYEPQPDQDELIAAVDSTYRKELIRISRLIHSKPSAAVREFARAFRIKKDRE
jgi:hypothetical protein